VSRQRTVADLGRGSHATTVAGAGQEELVEVTDAVLARAAEELQIEDDTSRRILDAAVERFTRFGIRRTTMDDVAAAAGVGRATLYRRFAGRDEIVRASVTREMARFVTNVHGAVRDLDDPGEQLVEGFVTILRAAREHPLLNRLIETEPEYLLPFLTTQGGPVLAMCRDYLAGQLAAAQRAGTMVADLDPSVVAELVVRLSQSLLLTPTGVIDADDEDGLRRVARACFLPALFPTTRATT
jgi:AcrR family transcriptional regulator